MVARGAGAVGCAHCKVIGAEASCEVCTRLVCPACERDWTTCDVPFARCIRLGRGARLRDVDPSGHVGLVSRWSGSMRAIDLRALRWVRADFGDYHRFARVTRDRRLFYPLVPVDMDGDRTMLVRPLDGGEASPLHTVPPLHGAAVTRRGDVYYYVANTQVIVAILPDLTRRELATRNRNEIQAAYVDLERGVLASGTWGEIAVHRVHADGVALVGHTPTSGTLHWIEIAGPWLAAIVDRTLFVWRLERDEAIGRLVYQHERRDTWFAASLSSDGRYLAAGHADGVLVHQLDDDIEATFDDHSDDLSLVRFVGDDHLLVTADYDNRVIIRPRTASGYARAIMDVDLPDDDVAP